MVLSYPWQLFEGSITAESSASDTSAKEVMSSSALVCPRPCTVSEPQFSTESLHSWPYGSKYLWKRAICGGTAGSSVSDTSATEVR